jgi:hypothetical protein
MQGRRSFRFSPSWQTVIFGTARQARDAFKNEGLNYFFFLKSFRQCPRPATCLPAFLARWNRQLCGRKMDGRNELSVDLGRTWHGADLAEIPERLQHPVHTDGYDIEGSRRLWRPVSDYITAHKSDLRPFAGS